MSENHIQSDQDTNVNQTTPELDPMLKRAWQTWIRYDRAALRLKQTHTNLRAFVLILSFFASFLAVAVGFITSSRSQNFDSVYPFIVMLLPLLIVLPVGYESWKRWRKRIQDKNSQVAQNESEPSNGSRVNSSSNDDPQQFENLVALTDETDDKQRFSNRMIYGILIVSIIIQILVIFVIIRQISSVSVIQMGRLVLFILPLLSTGILAYATRFVPSTLWVQYRSIAEAIRRETYLYRFTAGAYANVESDKRNDLLLKHLNIIEETGFLPDKDEKVVKEDIVPINVFEPPNTMSDADLKAKLAKARFINTSEDDHDDGFTKMGFDKYLKYRVYPMYNWYTRKSHSEFKGMRDWQIVGLIIGGAGALLAFLGEEAWIAVTTSGAVTVAALANLRLSGRTYLLYYRTANDLIDRVSEWQNDKSRIQKEDNPDDSAEPQQENELTIQVNPADLVSDFEDIFHQEGKLWRRQAIDALSQVDSSISETFRSGTGNLYIPKEWLPKKKENEDGSEETASNGDKTDGLQNKSGDLNETPTGEGDSANAQGNNPSVPPTGSN